MRYLIKHRLCFTNAAGVTQRLAEGDIVSFDAGDDVNIPSLLKLGAIEIYRKRDKRLIPEVDNDD